MKVRMLTDYPSPSGTFRRGQTYDVAPYFAEQLVTSGAAQYAASEPETATHEPAAERAVRPSPRKRTRRPRDD
jgi:hypothetical protein